MPFPKSPEAPELATGSTVVYQDRVMRVRRVRPGRVLDLEAACSSSGSVERHRGVPFGPGGWRYPPDGPK